MASKNATTFFIADTDLWEKEEPYQIDHLKGPGIVVTNVQKEEHELPLTDLRTMDFRPTMKENLFEFIERPSELTKHVLEDDEHDSYAEETIPVLQEMCNTEHVICFNLRVRKAPSDGIITPSAPVHDAHFDYSLEDGCIWRPLQDVVDDDSLAFCDPNTLDFKDAVPGNRVGPGYAAEIAHLKYNPDQKWYWMGRMTPDQLAVFQCFDSHALEGKFNTVEHAAFKNWKASPETPLRKSVETRYMVFTPAPFEAPIDPSPPKRLKEQPWQKWIQVADRSGSFWESDGHVRLTSYKAK